MKKILLLLPALLACTGAIAQETAVLPAPEPKNNRHILKLVPQEFIVSTFRLDYELKTGKKTSLQLSPSFTSGENATEFDKVTGGGADVTARFYLRTEGEQLKGFYGGLNASFHKFKISDYYSYNGFDFDYHEKQNVTKIGGNLVLGYQFLFQNVVALDLYVGGGIRAARIKEDLPENVTYSFPDPRYSGIAPKAGFSIGVVL